MPTIVQQADDYWQHSPVSSKFPLGSIEHRVNLWGESPGAPGAPPAPGVVENQSKVPITPHDLSSNTANPVLLNKKAIGHSEVEEYYLSLLGTLKNPKLPPEITPFK